MHSIARLSRLGIALGSVLLITLGAACSAGPDAEPTASSDEALVGACPIGYTHTCTNEGPPSNPIVCTPCVPGIWSKMTSLNGDPTVNCQSLPNAPAPIAAPLPTELWGLGCVAGVYNHYPIWACPEASIAKLPSSIPSLSSKPVCSADAGINYDCEVVVSFPASSSPCLGVLPNTGGTPPKPLWEFVALETAYDIIATPCNGGCPAGQPAAPHGVVGQIPH